jgi:hypothetical protein
MFLDVPVELHGPFPSRLRVGCDWTQTQVATRLSQALEHKYGTAPSMMPSTCPLTFALPLRLPSSRAYKLSLPAFRFCTISYPYLYDI